MNPLFEILWIVIALFVVLFIQRTDFRKTSFYKVGLKLIFLSFLCGLTLLAVALFML